LGHTKKSKINLEKIEALRRDSSIESFQKVHKSIFIKIEILSDSKSGEIYIHTQFSSKITLIKYSFLDLQNYHSHE